MKKNYLLMGLVLALVGGFSLAALSKEGNLEFTSTTVNNHSHMFTLGKADLETPPAEGISRMTTTNSNHNHMVTLTKQQLENIKNGMEEVVKTSEVGMHTHEFTFKKMK